MRLKASDTGGIWPYEKRLTSRYFIPPQSGPMGVLKRLLRAEFNKERYIAQNLKFINFARENAQANVIFKRPDGTRLTKEEIEKSLKKKD